MVDETRFRLLIAARLKTLDEEDKRGFGAQATVELDQQSVGRLSRQDALLSQSMAKAMAARRAGERRGLLAALQRIDEGEYGWCEDCGDPIPEGRLALDLTAARCVSCASR